MRDRKIGNFTFGFSGRFQMSHLALNSLFRLAQKLVAPNAEFGFCQLVSRGN
jgi:hypothetical protein